MYKESLYINVLTKLFRHRKAVITFILKGTAKLINVLNLKTLSERTF